MTITATAQPLDSPPSVQLQVSVPAGNVMTSVQLWRNDGTGRHLVRSQPSAGFESRTITDYECPYEAPVTYEWAAEYYDQADLVPTFSEPFSSWPGSWTGNTGSGSVSGNVLTFTAAASADRTVTRTASAAWDVISIAGITGGMPTTSLNRFELVLAFASGSSLRLAESGGTVWLTGPFPTDTAIDATGFTLEHTPTGVRLSDGALIFDIAGARGDLSSVSVTSVFAASAVMTVGAITASTTATLLDIAEASAPVSLNPADAWLIAPQAPVLSVPLSPDPRSTRPQVAALGSIRNTDQKTYHSILGTDKPVTTASGPQGSDETTLVVRTRTRDQEIALRAISGPQLPVLIRFPPSFGYDFQDDYYAIGTLERARIAQTPDYQPRRITLPLTAVEAPIVDVENVGWSWAALAVAYPSWTAMQAAYATWADVVADNRIGD